MVEKYKEVQRAEAKEQRRESSPQNAHNPKTDEGALITRKVEAAKRRSTILSIVVPRTTTQ